jgi:hypothetical protein
MTIMVRQQMICIIAPDWPGEAGLSDPVSESLENLFSDVGVVHFASIALLPAMSDAQGQLPSLALELVTEEGLQPYDLLYRLVTHPSGAMWSLYKVYWPGGERPVGQRNQDLLKRLMSWHHVSDGGFVGARDRSVRQINRERILLEQTRSAARELKAQHGQDRASFALAIARWAFDDPALEWASEPAPRSFWRGSGASVIAKLAYPALIIGLWLALLWLIGALSRLTAHADAWLFDRPHSVVQALSSAVSGASGSLLGGSLRLLLASAVVAFALGVFFVALPALFASFRRWLERLGRELDRPTETLSSLSTYVAVWIVGGLLVVAAICYVVVYTLWPHFFKSTLASWIPAVPGWKQLIIGTLAIVVLVGIGALFSRFNRLLRRVNDWFYHPLEDDVDRAQQVHLSIEECEAKSVGGTAHMISLTDMRSPHWWSVWWTRLFLRLVTLLGRVFFTEGRLGDAPGIHFGHWHIIDNGRRYLFYSNYDGDFGGYLDDFINGASAGTTLFWRWTELKRRKAAASGQPKVAEPRAFPPTRFLAFRGVKCELKFKSYARDSMLPHLYHFDACNRTIDEINQATVLRDALFGTRNDCNDDLIMRAIES